ncbi:hypothetical protein ACFLR5_00545 [Elusimicrobiota bacterium]
MDVRSGNQYIEDLETINISMNKYQLGGLRCKFCIAYLLSKRSFAFKNNRVAFVIVAELRRLGRKKSVIEKIMMKWAHSLVLPMRDRTIDKAIQSCFNKEYITRCGNEILSSYCVCEDLCPMNMDDSDKKKNPIKSYRQFYLNGWQRKLNNSDVLLYLGLINYELANGYNAGDLMYMNYYQINNNSGVSIPSIKKALMRLENTKLIEVKFGKPLKWQKIGTSVKRIMPIPMPKY